MLLFFSVGVWALMLYVRTSLSMMHISCCPRLLSGSVPRDGIRYYLVNIASIFTRLTCVADSVGHLVSCALYSALAQGDCTLVFSMAPARFLDTVKGIGLGIILLQTLSRLCSLSLGSLGLSESWPPAQLCQIALVQVP
jgi:hypothetical protein